MAQNYQSLWLHLAAFMTATLSNGSQFAQLNSRHTDKLTATVSKVNEQLG